jgi:sugar phosphate isomerase/epimerase
MGMSEAVLYEWEKRGRSPSVRQWPHVFAFLGYDPHPEPVTTAEALRALRRRQGWSQRELARHLGVDPVTVWEWERGREPHNRRCRERVLALLRRVNGVSSGSEPQPI